jgi:carbamoyltransferase
MNILGISAFYHDSAAALLRDGGIVAAAQEERFTRRKHDPRFPENAIRYCLAAGGIGLDDVDHIVFNEKPFLKFERLLETYLANAPRGFRSFKAAIPVWIKEKLFQKANLIKAFEAIGAKGKVAERLLFAEHHQSHAASAFFPSPFPEAVVLTLDGVGEWATASVSLGRGGRLDIVREIRWPHSLGLLYSAFTYYTGFKVNSGEYKVMGLAPYGEPRYAQTILDNLIDLKEDGSFWLDQSYFDYATGLRMTSAKFDALFGGKPRDPGERLTQRHMDLAASVQKVTEEVMLRMTRELARTYAIPNLCIAGGVALNCVANGKILRDGKFRNLWMQPAAGDAGGALGAALAAWHTHLGNERRLNGALDGMQGSFLGPSYGQDEMERRLAAAGARFDVLADDAMLARTIEALEAGDAVGWFQGRMEFGPRALGNRSILGDPRSPQMQEQINLKIKFRESFRPFAPSVLKEKAAEYFDLDRESPYMLLVAPVKEDRCRPLSPEDRACQGLAKLKVVRSGIPAVTHVDYSARLQTVAAEDNPLYHRLISKFHQKCDCPVIINTSFNVRGEPIVCTPEEAYLCFMRTHMDYLVLGNFLLDKSAQKPLEQDIDWTREYELD